MLLKVYLKIRLFLIILAFFCCYAALAGAASAADYCLYNPRVYEMEYRASVVNLGKNDIKGVTFDIPLIKNNFPNQKVDILGITPQGYKIVTDSLFNKDIQYKIKIIKAFEKKTFTVKCKVRVYGLFYNIDFNKFLNITSADGQFLRPQKYIESDSRLVRHFAFKIAGAEKNSYLSSLKFYDYLRENINFDFRAKLCGAESALKNKLTGCGDAALLYAALCRAYGIPARYCAGFYLGNLDMDDRGRHAVTDTHAWDEVYLNSDIALPVDPTQGRFNQMRRFQCFAQQGNDYITVWKDRVEPVTVSCRDKKTITDLYISFSAVIQKENLTTNPPQFDMFKATFPPLNKRENNEALSGEYYQALNYARLKDYSAALRKLKNIAAKDKKDSPSVYNAMGYIHLQTHNYKEAFRCFVKSIALNPRNITAYENMINLFNYIKQYDEALRWIKTAKKYAPSAPQLFAAEGEIYLAQKKQFDKSLRCLEKAVSLNGGEGYYFYLLGLVYLNKGPGYKNTAESYFKKALNLGVDKITENNIKTIKKMFFRT